jgi:ABC-2 type transport system permease protein
MFTSLRALILKELRQTMRDRESLIVLVLAPLVQLVVFGYAVNLDVTRVETLLVDQDRTTRSREFLRALTAGETFETVGRFARVDAAMDGLTAGEVELVVVVPRGFGRELRRGETAEVQLLIDGVDSNRATVARGAAEVITTLQSVSVLRKRIAALAAERGAHAAISTVTIEPRVYYNPSLDGRLFFVPGVAATVVLIVVVIVTALGISREKESGTLEQVMVTPIRPTVLVLGKTLPYALIGLLDFVAVIAAGALLFDVPLRGSMLLLLGGGALYLVNLVALGTLIGTVSRNQQQALIGAMFFSLPAILLSGFVTPIENMPQWLQPWTVANPVRHSTELLRGVLLKGARVNELLPQLVVMAGLGFATYAFAAALLRRRMR